MPALRCLAPLAAMADAGLPCSYEQSGSSHSSLPPHPLQCADPNCIVCEQDPATCTECGAEYRMLNGTCTAVRRILPLSLGFRPAGCSHAGSSCMAASVLQGSAAATGCEATCLAHGAAVPCVAGDH